MTHDSDARKSLESYLTRHGWSPSTSGQFGEMWERERNEGSRSLRLAVPFELNFDSEEFKSIATRLSMWSGLALSEVVSQVDLEFRDVQSFRIGDHSLIANTAPLDGAVTLLAAARKLYRAAATTARRARPSIGANYSKPGDELAKRARLAHTKQGSYVMPIEMRVSAAAPANDQIGDSTITIESQERGLTRTLASAVAAVNTVVIQPEREPGPDEVMSLVQNGVSKEFVVAIREASTASGVNALDVKFEWSSALGVPKQVPARIVIPDEAGPLLTKTIETLGRTKPEPDAVFSGQIVRTKFAKDDPFGEISIRTERKGRQVEIAVVVDSRTMHDAYDWARDHRQVMVTGALERQVAGSLVVKSPKKVMPVDELLDKAF